MPTAKREPETEVPGSVTSADAAETVPTEAPIVAYGTFDLATVRVFEYLFLANEAEVSVFVPHVGATARFGPRSGAFLLQAARVAPS